MSEQEATRSAESWHALVIGVDSYPELSAHSQLDGCVNDALEIRKFLVRHVQVPARNVHLLVAPRSPKAMAELAPLGAKLAVSQQIRATFEEIRASVGPRAQVVVYYAGHGIRINKGNTAERVYGFAPSDISLERGKLSKLILDREINAFLRSLTESQARVTVLVDTCHSGTSLRALTRRAVRALPDQVLSSEEWEELLARQPDFVKNAPRAPASHRSLDTGSGWFEDGDRDWVVLSACRDIETAKEDELDSVPHGLFSAYLLQRLRKVTEKEIRHLRWKDLFEDLRDAVQSRARELALGPQTPVLEGRAEKTIFGGAWQIFEPGFTAQRGDSASEILLDGGVLDGLDEGAVVAIYPPETARFADAEAAGIRGTRARIESATPLTSRARLIDAGAQIQDKSRAHLVAPSPRVQRMSIKLGDLPEPLAARVRSTPGIEELVEFDPLDRRPDLELCPWPQAIPSWARWSASVPKPSWVGAEGGFALAPYTRSEVEPTQDEVIAYLPPLEAIDTAPEKTLGRALGKGILHWARYLLVQRLSYQDQRLSALIGVTLRVGRNLKAAQEPARCDERQPGPTGIYELVEGEALWLGVHIKATPRNRIFLAILACSGDGNTIRIWPPSGGDPSFGGLGSDEEHGLVEGQKIYVGLSKTRPAQPTVREDQSKSQYTFKVIAVVMSDSVPPPSLSGWILDDSVQDLIVEEISPTRSRGRLEQTDAEAQSAPVDLRDAWCVWDLPVCVRRARD